MESYNKYILDKILKEYSGGVNYELSNKWEGFRSLVLVDKIKECEEIVSLYFKAEDGKKLIEHKAGQYLPIKIKTEDQKYKDELRTYSLSMKSNDSLYRISVKRIEGGLISTYLHENLNIGDCVEAMIPTGIFTLDEKNDRPMVLMSGGIGITPLLSMVYEWASSNAVNKNIYFIQAVQNSNVQPFRYDLEKISENNGLRNIVFYSSPLETDKDGVDYDFKGYINKEWISKNLPMGSDFYFCGPPIFMKSLNKSLLELGVDKNNIKYEFFGESIDME